MSVCSIMTDCETNNEILLSSQCRLTAMGKTQISREGDRFEVPIDIVRLSILVAMIIDIDKDRDGNDSENGLDKRRRHEIPYMLINLLTLTKIVRFFGY